MRKTAMHIVKILKILTVPTNRSKIMQKSKVTYW